VGASLVLYPASMRIMHQFGILEGLQAVGAELVRTQSLTRDGQLFRDTNNVRILKECYVLVVHGISWLAVVE
jgi:hypothetical protein